MRPHPTASRRRACALPPTRLSVEALENRTVPYALTGNAWPRPELIALSFVPDGTLVAQSSSGHVTSNLFQIFNAKFGSAPTWQNQVLRAAQTWAAQTNINFAVKTDSGSSAGSGSYQQGDPNFGDVRFGGYNYGSPTLASAFLPPPANNYSLAGDVNFNTNQTFNINTTYDLFTVALHEIGHALGVGHSDSSSASLYPTYGGVRTGLGSDDIAGIRAVYSNGAPRAADAYDAGSGNNSVATATDVTPLIDAASKTALVTNLDLTTATDKDVFRFTVPAGTTGTLVVKVQSAGLSLLAPKATVLAADGTTVKGSANGFRQYGTTLTVTVTGVSAGETYYLRVEGADATVFATGRYAVTLNFGSGASPTVPLPNTQVANGNPIQNGGGLAEEDGQLIAALPGVSQATPTPTPPIVAPRAAVAESASAPSATLPTAPRGTAPESARLAAGRTADDEEPTEEETPAAATATPEKIPAPTPTDPEMPTRPAQKDEDGALRAALDATFAHPEHLPFDTSRTALLLLPADAPWSGDAALAAMGILFGNVGMCRHRGERRRRTRGRLEVS